MSTTINVTVDDGGLPAKNRQQTAANRQAYVQGRASQQAAQQGADQRAADRRAAGLDPTTGRPLASAGASSRLPRIDQEPAANRGGFRGVLLTPQLGYINYGGTLTGLQSKTGQNSPPIFSRLNVEDSTVYVYGRDYGEMLYVPEAGPSGSYALQVQNLTGPLTVATPYEDFEEEPLNAAYFETVVPNDRGTPARSGLRYAATAASYDGVPRWQSEYFGLGLVDPVTGDGPFDSLLPTPPFDVLSLEQQLQPAQARPRVASSYQSATHEFYCQMRSNPINDYPYRIIKPGETLATVAGRRSTINLATEGIVVSLGTFEFSTFVGFQTIRINGSPFIVNARAFFYEPPRVNVSVSSPAAYLSTLPSPTNLEEGPFADSPIVSGLTDDMWIHVALVRTLDQETQRPTWAVYINGQRLLDGILATNGWLGSYGQQPISAAISLSSFSGLSSPPDQALPAVHGYRFTPKALYTGAVITPPPFITSFA
jgi:hypothetical protein